MPRLARLLGVVALAVVAVVLPTSPASAAPFSLPITSGTIWLGSTPLALPGACPATLDGDLTSTTAEVTDIDALLPITIGPNSFLVDVSYLPGYSVPGNVTGSTPAAIGTSTLLEFGVELDFYTVAGTCTPGTHVCELGYIAAHTGTYSGNPASMQPGDDLVLDGYDITGGLQVLTSCAAGPFFLIGEPVTHEAITASVPSAPGPVPASGEILGGTITVDGTTVALPGACPTDTAEVTLGAGSAEVTDLDARVHLTYAGTNYVVDIDYTSSVAGDAAGASPATVGTSTALELVLEIDVYQRAAACTPGTLRCEAGFSFDGVGTFSGDPANPASGDELAIGGSDTSGGLQSLGTCNAPLASLLNDAVTVAGLTIALD